MTTETPQRTHFVSYAFCSFTGSGTGAIDMTLPNGFDGPETRKEVEKFILGTDSNFTAVHITNVIRYGSL